MLADGMTKHGVEVKVADVGELHREVLTTTIATTC